MSDITLGKRKSNDNEAVADDEEAKQFKSVPDVCWHLVAEFAAPPDGEMIMTFVVYVSSLLL